MAKVSAVILATDNMHVTIHHDFEGAKAQIVTIHNIDELDHKEYGYSTVCYTTNPDGKTHPSNSVMIVF